MDGVPARLLKIIHSGVDIHKYDNIVPPKNFKSKLGIPEHHLFIGTVAAMADHKDYPNLLKAARIVLNNNDNITFCAVGSGPEENRVLALAKKLQLEDRFIFAGFRKDVGNFLKSFDIFVLSSHLEGLGTSILDAQGVGLPIVACKTGGIPEIIDNDINGLLVPPKNPEALAKAILYLVQNDSRRKKLGENSKQTVQQFSIEKTVQRYLELYDELLASS
jgi:glycosyltransferase involved in cell wall biosynthesis